MLEAKLCQDQEESLLLVKDDQGIASLKIKFKSLKRRNGTSTDDEADGDSEPQENADDHFGGRKDKKKKK